MMLIVLAALALVVAAALLWQLARQQLPATDGWATADGEPDLGRLESRLMNHGRSLWRTQTARQPLMARLSLLLRQGGYVGTRAQVALLTSLLLVMAGVAVMAGLYGWQTGEPGGAAAARMGLSGLLLTAVGSWLWLKQRRQQRARALADEVEVTIQVTRMLWESGMTLEGVLRGLIVNLAEVAPATVLELRVALNRVTAGQEREAALEELAALQPAEASHQYFRLLARLSVSGSGATEALLDLSRLLRDHQRTSLQEKVTRLSGQMSLVMMVFLFPALLIVLAGPAVVNLGSMLQAFGG